MLEIWVNGERMPEALVNIVFTDPAGSPQKIIVAALDKKTVMRVGLTDADGETVADKTYGYEYLRSLFARKTVPAIAAP